METHLSWQWHVHCWFLFDDFFPTAWLEPVFLHRCGGVSHQTSLRSPSITMCYSNSPSRLGRRVTYSVLVQREMEKQRSPLAQIPPLRGGDFRGMWVYRPMTPSGQCAGERRASRAAGH